MQKLNFRVMSWIAALCLGSALYGEWTIARYKEAELARAQQPRVVDVRDAEVDSGDLNFTNSSSSLPTVSSVSDNNSFDIAETQGDFVTVNTDVVEAKISLYGGDLVYLQLKDYHQSLENSQGVELVSTQPESYMVAQSGLLSQDGPDSKRNGRAAYTVDSLEYNLPDGDDSLSIALKYTTDKGVVVNKIYTFERGKYNIGVSFAVDNKSNDVYSALPFGRLKWVQQEPTSRGLGVNSFSGGMIKTNKSQDSYKKIPYDDFSDKDNDLTMRGGWVANVGQYFLSAWIPSPEHENSLSSEVLSKKIDGNKVYSLRFLNTAIMANPGEAITVSNTLYVGPETAGTLKELSPGLQKTVDYGIFWPIAAPIFSLLKFIQSLVGNWGLAILGTTLLIKMLFYYPSASSYRSMAKMKKMQPKIEELKEKHGEDRQALGQAMMQLYKKEKVNPLGGCLPLLIQIPVFIALYWVLIESVELRQAPFYLWIHDLSAKDPFYVLPILMGASMFLQQRLSPAPPDPVQAKVMMAMPVIFTFMFLNFPSGLVLYWLANNILSILQQLFITKQIENDNGTAKSPKGRTPRTAKQIS